MQAIKHPNNLDITQFMRFFFFQCHNIISFYQTAMSFTYPLVCQVSGKIPICFWSEHLAC